MNPAELDKRVRIIEESDAVCEGCGRDPRNAMDAPFAYQDPAWHMTTETVNGAEIAVVRCPDCVADNQDEIADMRGCGVDNPKGQA